MNFLKLVLIVVMLVLANSAQAFVITEYFESAHVSPHANYFSSGSNVHSIAQILEKDATGRIDWQKQAANYPNFGHSNSSHWVRVILENESTSQENFIFQIDYPLLDVVDFYTLKDGDLVQRYHLGDQVPFHLRVIKDRSFAFPVYLETQEKQIIYLHIRSQNAVAIPLKLYNESDYFQSKTVESTIFGFYFGAILIVFLYNLFIYLFLQGKTEVIFCSMIASYALMELAITGMGNMYLWGEYNEFGKRVLPFSMGMLAVSLVVLVRSYLDQESIKLRSWRLDSPLVMLGFACMACAFVLPYNYSNKLSTVALMLSILAVGYVSMMALKNGKRLGRYLLIGWLGLVMIGIVNILPMLNLLPIDFFTIYGSLFGSVFTFIVWNLGVSEKMRGTRVEKDSAEQKIIVQQRRLNRELDTKVKERTIALENTMQKAQKARESAENALQVKTQFLANMSHEIRTPMNGVIGMTQILETTELDEGQKNYLTTIRNSGEALLRIINDILDFSKIEAGKLEIENVEFPLRRLLDDSVSLLAMYGKDKDVRFICVVDPNVPEFVCGDPTRVRQILANLMSNAFKFTDSGEVLLAVKYNEEEKIIHFSVKDSGIGISPEQQGRLFQSFSQADTSTTRKYGGTGLGLAICKSLAEAMGGSIGVNSETGKGSTFWFTISTPTVTSVEPIIELKDKVILVAESSPRAAASVIAIIESWGGQAKAWVQGDEFDSTIDLLLLSRYLSGTEILEVKNNYGCPILNIARSGEWVRNEVEKTLTSPITTAELRSRLYTAFEWKQVDSNEKKKESLDQFDLNVLVAEDNNVNRLVIKGLLKKFGIAADFAEDGEVAYNKVAERSVDYDLILMDCEMPVMDGYEATKRIKAIWEKTDQANRMIIGLSAHAMAEHRSVAIAAGMDGYLSKPVSLDELQHELQHVQHAKNQRILDLSSNQASINDDSNDLGSGSTQ